MRLVHLALIVSLLSASLLVFGSSDDKLAIGDAEALGRTLNSITTTVSVAATSTSVLAANSRRKILILQNDGGDKVYCEFDAAAAVDNGIVFVEDATLLLDIDVPIGAINCISAGGAVNILATEFQ